MSMSVLIPGAVRTRSSVPALARGPVFTVAGAAGMLLLLLSGRYGYFGDELYFLAAGRHLAWGYADQPPLLPLLARAMDTIAPGSVTMLRVPAILATVAGIVLTALIARELGGRRRAQLLAAGAYAVCPQLLGTGHYLATSTIDPFLWTVVLWLLVRWVRTRADGLLLWVGVATAVAINAKFLILAFWPVVGICLLVFGPRQLLGRPLLWIGAAIALVGAMPTIVWQASNGWPQLAMGQAISNEVTQTGGGRAIFLPFVLVGSGVLVGMVLLVYGLWQLFRRTHLRPYRFLGAVALGLVVVFFLVNGRYYYVAGMYPILWAAAAVALQHKPPARWWRWIPTWPVYLLGLVVTLPTTLPIFPASWIAANPSVPRPTFATEELGWPQFVDSVAVSYLRLPPEQRAHTAVVTETYWNASAIERYGPSRAIPEVYSGNRGYWTFGRPAENQTDILFVGDDPAYLADHFTELRRIGTADNGLGVDNGSQGRPIWLATGKTEPWSALWPKLRDFSA